VILGKVVGEIVSEMKIEDYKSLKMLIIQPIDPEGNPTGETTLAVDNVQAGVGDTILILDEGGSARMLMEEPEIFTIRAVVAGVVDHIERDVK
jgi:ethanolamine utilization protein EutN